jgi:hypothetical protein
MGAVLVVWSIVSIVAAIVASKKGGLLPRVAQPTTPRQC